MRKDIKILLVGDKELVCHGLRNILELEEDMEVVGDCASTEETFSQVVRLSPDIVLMDARMPAMNVIEATRCLKGNKLHCDTDIIILAECADYLVGALEAGAAGYLLKDTKRDDLVQTIRQVYQNEHLVEETRFSWLTLFPLVLGIVFLGVGLWSLFGF